MIIFCNTEWVGYLEMDKISLLIFQQKKLLIFVGSTQYYPTASKKTFSEKLHEYLKKYQIKKKEYA